MKPSILNNGFRLTIAVFTPVVTVVQNTATDEPANLGFGLLLLLATVIVILVMLAVWLLKNSAKLKDTLADNDTNGKTWLREHLSDLDHRQLDVLTQHHHLTGDKSLNDTTTRS